MIDRDPVETGAEVALRVLHQLSREGPKVSDLARVLWGDCEPEAAMAAGAKSAVQGRSETNPAPISGFVPLLFYVVTC